MGSGRLRVGRYSVDGARCRVIEESYIVSVEIEGELESRVEGDFAVTKVWLDTSSSSLSTAQYH